MRALGKMGNGSMASGCQLTGRRSTEEIGWRTNDMGQELYTSQGSCSSLVRPCRIRGLHVQIRDFLNPPSDVLFAPGLHAGQRMSILC